MQKIIKRHIVKTSLHENDEIAYWSRKSPSQRLKALELNRKIIYGYGDNPPRLQRFFEIVKQA